jgi:hypothetical protein
MPNHGNVFLCVWQGFPSWRQAPESHMAIPDIGHKLLNCNVRPACSLSNTPNLFAIPIRHLMLHGNEPLDSKRRRFFRSRDVSVPYPPALASESGLVIENVLSETWILTG